MNVLPPSPATTARGRSDRKLSALAAETERSRRAGIVTVVPRTEPGVNPLKALPRRRRAHRPAQVTTPRAGERPPRLDRNLVATVVLWWHGSQLRWLGVTEVFDTPEQQRTVAYFLRLRDSCVVWWTYSALFTVMFLAWLRSSVTVDYREAVHAAARAEFASSDAAHAAASDAASRLQGHTVAIVSLGLVALTVWLMVIRSWNAISLVVGGRDRNVGVATRGLLRSLNRGHASTVLARRRLLGSTGKWARAVRRAGVPGAVVDELVDAVKDPGLRDPGGEAGVRAFLVRFAALYDSGALIDAVEVMTQRSQTWARWSARLGTGVVMVMTIGATVYDRFGK